MADRSPGHSLLPCLPELPSLVPRSEGRQQDVLAGFLGQSTRVVSMLRLGGGQDLWSLAGVR